MAEPPDETVRVAPLASAMPLLVWPEPTMMLLPDMYSSMPPEEMLSGPNTLAPFETCSTPPLRIVAPLTRAPENTTSWAPEEMTVLVAVPLARMYS